MCCISNSTSVKEILSKFQPNDFLIGYKVYDFYNGKSDSVGPRILTPHRSARLSLAEIASGIVVSDSLKKSAYISNIAIYRGIHIYKEEGTAKKVIDGSYTRKYIKVYGQVKDLLGVGYNDAVFHKIYLDRDWLVEALQSKKM